MVIMRNGYDGNWLKAYCREVGSMGCAFKFDMIKIQSECNLEEFSIVFSRFSCVCDPK